MSREYIFQGWYNFVAFCQANDKHFFHERNDEASEVLKNQVDLFIKSFFNTQGGCPCNKGKRNLTCQKMYIETATMLTKDKETRNRMISLLENPDKVLFFSGESNGNPSPRKSEPFIKIEKDGGFSDFERAPPTVTELSRAKFSETQSTDETKIAKFRKEQAEGPQGSEKE